MRSEADITRAITQHGDMVRRLCLVYLKNNADAEDIFQNVFLKYALHTEPFVSGEQEKAWLIRVTRNACKDLCKSFFRSRTVSLDTLVTEPALLSADNRDVLEAVLALPAPYREVVYLHYYEGYTAPQIGQILGKNVNTVYTRMTRSKALLKKALGGDEDA